MLVTPDTLKALRLRLAEELATLQAAMNTCDEWTGAENNAFGPTAVSIMTWIAQPTHLMSLGADYNDGLSRRNSLLKWWDRFLAKCPGGPPKPAPLEKSEWPPNPLDKAADLLTAGAVFVGVAAGAYIVYRLLQK